MILTQREHGKQKAKQRYSHHTTPLKQGHKTLHCRCTRLNGVLFIYESPNSSRVSQIRPSFRNVEFTPVFTGQQCEVPWVPCESDDIPLKKRVKIFQEAEQLQVCSCDPY